MFKEFFFSIVTIGFILAASIISPLSDAKKKNFLHRDFVNRNFINDDQSTPNLYPLSFQSPNILTNIEGVPTREVQSQENIMFPYFGSFEPNRSAPMAPVKLPNIVLVISVHPNQDVSRAQVFEEMDGLIVDGVEKSSHYIVKTVREFNRDTMTSGRYLYNENERE